MNQEHYNAVRDAVIKAVPEIMELKFGCHYQYENEDYSYAGGANLGDVKEIADKYPKEIKVLGRPIRLADVLLAYKKKWEGTEFDYFNAGEFKVFLSRYDLRQDDLCLQSPETIEFLYNLFHAH